MVFDKLVGWKWLGQDLDKKDAKVSQYETNLLSFVAGVRGFENGLIEVWTENNAKVIIYCINQ